MGAVLISIIFSCFQFYSAVVSTGVKHELIGYSILNNLWNLLLFCFIFAVVSVCSWSKREARNTIILLHKALHYQEDEAIQKRVRKQKTKESR